MSVKVKDDMKLVRTMKYKHSSATVKDTIYVLQDMIMLAVNSADANTNNVFVISGLIEYAKVSAQAWTSGQKVYYDAVNTNFTTVAGGNKFAGIAAEDAANPTATGLIILIIPKIVTPDLFTQVTATTIATVGNETLTAAQLLTRLILRDPAGGARTDTTATAAQIVAAVPNPAVGTAFRIIIRNTADAAETITIAGGTGVTISGTATIAQNNTKDFLCVLTNVTAAAEAVTIYSIGTFVH